MVGFVSIGDLVKYRIDRIEAEAEAMRSYIQRRESGACGFRLADACAPWRSVRAPASRANSDQPRRHRSTRADAATSEREPRHAAQRSAAARRRPASRSAPSPARRAAAGRSHRPGRATRTPITGSDRHALIAEIDRIGRRSTPARARSAPQCTPTRKAIGQQHRAGRAVAHADPGAAERVARGREQDLQRHERHGQREQMDDRRRLAPFLARAPSAPAARRSPRARDRRAGRRP